MTSKITVTVVEGKQLLAADRSGSSDPYVIVSIRGTKHHGKTKKISQNLNPKWNETFEFVGVDVFETNTISCEVYDKDTLTKDDFLGSCELDISQLVPDKLHRLLFPLENVSQGSLSLQVFVERMRDSKSAKKDAKKIVAWCKANNCKWTDKEFPPDNTSILMDPTKAKANVEWKRPSDWSTNPQLFVDGIEAGDVIQGALGDCYFLGALSVVATRKDLLEPLFVSKYPEYGFYQIKFWKNGKWQVVTIDDFIPVRNNKPIYGRCKDLSEIWVPLAEKAYAKLHQCYQAIESGSTATALTDLTGEGNQEISLDKIEDKSDLWNQLTYFAEEGFMMGCSFISNGNEKDNGMGILMNHAYGILKCKEPENGLKLLCLRNPWGQLEWKGRFSDESSDWTPALRKKLEVVVADDGVFWMTFEDWFSNFNQLIVLRLLTDSMGVKWNKFTFQGEWKGKSAGGCTNFPTWRNNPQYGITGIKHATKVFVSVSQPDCRIQWRTEYSVPMGIFIIRTSDATIRNVSYDDEAIVAKLPYVPIRDVAIEADVQPGCQYIIVPATYYPKTESTFVLDVYSEKKVTVNQVLDGCESIVKGQWQGVTAGGSYNHDTWKNNPKYCLRPLETPKGDIKLSVLLQQEESNSGALKYIGLYGGKYENKPIDDPYAITKADPCMNAREICVELILKPEEWPYFVVPHTFEPNQPGTFELTVHSALHIDIERIY